MPPAILPPSSLSRSQGVGSGGTNVTGSGGPGYSSYVLSYLIYNEGLLRNNMGSATAVSLVMFVLILTFTLIQFRLLRPRWEY